jgi:glycosyltransferase involved in cell wall biosynthesis
MIEPLTASVAFPSEQTSIEKLGPGVAFTGEAFRLQRFGGVSRMVLELHRNLVGRGYSTIISSAWSVSSMTSPSDRLTSSRKLPYSGKGATDVAGQLGLRSDRKVVRGLGHGWVVHRSYFGPPLRAHVPIVVTVHDMIAELYPGSFPRRDMTPRHKRQSLAEAAMVFAVSETTKADLVQLLDYAPSKVRVIPNGVNLPDEVAEVAALEKFAQTLRPYVLYVGQRNEYKNFPSVLRALENKSLRGLDLVCFGGPQFDATERSLIENSRLTDRVKHVSGDDVLLGAFYRGASCLVYPSRYEGFGIPPLEAMVRDCPVVASTGGSIPEVLGDAAVLVDPDDIDGFARGVDSVVVEGKRRSELVLAGRRRAAMYSWDTTADLALAAYRELI